MPMGNKGTIIDYAKGEFRPFSAFPLNEIDLAIFAYLSYFSFSAYLPLYADSVSFSDIYDLSKKEAFLRRRSYRKEDELLFTYLFGNPRFKDVRALRYAHCFLEKGIEQFAAVSFYLPTGEEVLSFRGTDGSLTGWKEDFLLSMDKPLESQVDALSYFRKELRYSDKPLYLVGHSKGGNLSAYCYFSANEAERKRIKKAYSFDGPGFSDEMKKNFVNDDKSKYVHMVPNESIIGQLFNDDIFSIVVSSYSHHFHQHNIYNWLQDGSSFVRASFVNPSYKRVISSFSNWARSLKGEDRLFVVDTIFTLLENAGITDINDILDSKVSSMLKIRDAYKRMDEESKKRIRLLTGGMPNILYSFYKSFKN